VKNTKEIRKEILKEFLFAIFLICITILFGSFPCIIAVLNGVPIDLEIDPAFVNGMLTVSGILLGFSSATYISRSEFLRPADFYLIYVDFIFFFLAVYHLFLAQLRGIVTVNELLWVTGSVYVDVSTVVILMNRLKPLLGISRTS
jgi:hypothetical protein